MSAREVYEAQTLALEARREATQTLDRLYFEMPVAKRDVHHAAQHPEYRAAQAEAERLDREVADLQAQVGGKVYRVLESKRRGLEERVEKLNRKAEKLGTEAITLTITDERDQEVRRIGEDKFLEPITRIFDYVFVVLDGRAPMVPGFAFIATLDHTVQNGDDGAVGIRRVPAIRYFLRHASDKTEEQAVREVEGIDLAPYRHAENRCDHCGYKRDRNQTYVVYELATGRTLQVGSTCLKAYTGALDPHRAATWAEWLAALDSDLGEGYGEEEYLAGGGGRRAIPVLDYLENVAAVIRTRGWHSRWDNYGDRNPDATADQAHSNMAAKRGDRIEITDEDEALAGEALDWVRNDLGERDDLDEFQHNLTTYSRSDYLPEKGDGFVAYIVMAYRRELERRILAEQTADLKATSEWIGQRGDRVQLTFRVTFVRAFDGNYGPSFLTKGVTPDGSVIVWWASKELEQGKTYSGRATVKEHETDEFLDGAKVTKVNRFSGQEVKDGELPDVETKVVKSAAQRRQERLRRLDRGELERELDSVTASINDYQRLMSEYADDAAYRLYYEDALERLNRRHRRLSDDLEALAATR